MPISTTDFQITLFQDYQGQACQNVFFYRKTTPHAVGDAQVLWAAFNTDVMNPLSLVQNTVVTYTGLSVINLADLSDYWSADPTAGTGAINSTSIAPRFVAYGFRYNRTTRAGRHGSKRFVGVAEELVAGGSTTLTSPLDVRVPALSAVLGGSINDGGLTFTPMIPRREIDPDPPLGEEDYVLVDLLPVASVQFTGLTTQNSRKR